MSQKQQILVTGATGFIAGHIIEILLKEGYRVRGTVRSLKNKEKSEHLQKLENSQNMEFVEVDLNCQDQQVWNKIVENCDYVLHTASPFPVAPPKHRDDLIKPAVQGTESIIKAAINNQNIKKVVLTSSLAAVFPGNEKNFLSSEDWSDPEKSNAYEASKHLAEKKAWQLIEECQQKGRNLPLTVINPGFVMGPTHSIKNSFTSGDFVCNMMTQKIPGLAKVSMPFVDVREVALAHYRAVFTPASDNKRYVLCQSTYWFEDIGQILDQEFKQYGYKVTTKVFGSCTLSIAALFNNEAKQLKPYVGRLIQFDNSATIKDLGIEFRSARESLLDSAYDYIEKGLIVNKLPKNHKKTHNIHVFTNKQFEINK